MPVAGVLCPSQRTGPGCTARRSPSTGPIVSAQSHHRTPAPSDRYSSGAPATDYGLAGSPAKGGCPPLRDGLECTNFLCRSQALGPFLCGFDSTSAVSKNPAQTAALSAPPCTFHRVVRCLSKPTSHLDVRVVLYGHSDHLDAGAPDVEPHAASLARPCHRVDISADPQQRDHATPSRGWPLNKCGKQ